MRFASLLLVSPQAWAIHEAGDERDSKYLKTPEVVSATGGGNAKLDLRYRLYIRVRLDRPYILSSWQLGYPPQCSLCPK